MPVDAKSSAAGARNQGTGSSAEIIIVGGSLAGLMTALAVAAPNRSVRLLERTGPHPRSGAALAADPADLRELLGSDGAAAVLHALAAEAGGSATSHPARWTTLHTAFHSLAARNPHIDLLHNVTVAAAGQDDQAAWVRTVTGERQRAALVVGADGHRSIIRGVIDPKHPDATFAGYTLWLGVADAADIDYRPMPEGLDIRSSGPHYLLGYALPAEHGTQRLGWAWYDSTRNTVLRQLGSVNGSVVQHSIRPADMPADVLYALDREARRHWPRPWRDAILDSIRKRDVTGTPIAEYVPSHLVNGRMALVGDAAHVPTPMTGRGYAESIADAIALRNALNQTENVEDALVIYERARLSSARRLVQSGQSFSRSFASPS